MQRFKHYFILGMLVCSMVMLVGCDGFSGCYGGTYEVALIVEDRPLPWGLRTRLVRRPIPGVEITFANKDTGVARTVTSDHTGAYAVNLVPGPYEINGRHPDYVRFYNNHITVFEVGPQEAVLFMGTGPTKVLMITTSLLDKEPDFDELVREYRDVLYQTEALLTYYIEVDNADYLGDYNTAPADPTDWEDIQRVLDDITSVTGPAYFMILGGKDVVPRPELDFVIDGQTVPIPSDAWYIDFNGDRIVNEFFPISRLPDVADESSAVVAALETAIELHQLGGYSLDTEVLFGLGGYETPPYGMCTDCTMRAEFFDLMSTSDYIIFAGHGSPIAFSTGVEPRKTIFSIAGMRDIEWENYNNHPVIIGYYSCSTGCLDYPSTGDRTLSYRFLGAGAAAFVARTTGGERGGGVPQHVIDHFEDDIQAGIRIGDALFQAMGETPQVMGAEHKLDAGHLCLYGDPTLRRR